MPSDIGNSKNGAFKYLKDSLWSKVQGWIANTMSSAGKEVLVKAVAQAVHVFSMSCFKLPRGLCEHLNKLIRKFWWGSKEGKRKPHWVSWQIMTQPKGMGGLGFKDFELFNLAMLARQAWRLLQHPNTLCARILRSIYHPQSDILEAQLGGHPSQVWRAVIEGRDTLKQGLIRRIGNEETTYIWRDNWIPREEMLRPYGCLATHPPARVSELIDHTSASWDRARVEATFLPMDSRIILSIPLCTRNLPDFWSWHYEKHGVFSVKSAYRMIVATKQRREAWLDGNPGSSNSNAEEGSWKTLWKTPVPAKVRMFLWRLSKHSLPTNDVRAHRHMADSASCGLCGAPDSWRHSPLECAASRCVWALIDNELVHKMTTVTEPNAKHWLFSLMEMLEHDKFVLLSVTLWAIWSARRKAIHEGIFQSPQSTQAFIRRFIDDLQITSAQQKPTPARVPVSVTSARPRAKAPPSGYAKIHVDAAVRHERGGAAVAVCRDEGGNYLGSSALVVYGVSNPTILEATACREALALAEDMNLTHCVISSDCKQVVSDITNGTLGAHGAIIAEIRAKAELHNLKFIFKGRAVNYEAHRLARFSISQGLGRHVSHLQRE
ncbi:unnamed protein product [Triticum turgidum subsp. durum]|uniref:Reverse transcriptase zinc-binding domain-containing protein n=1 Tax=Triticum turgidum subsp. durum TaxID=4567 RepID=A0A9R1AMV0_TRITD|nr:unnamed protein product [Triticum turgidum subsp. durum]